MIVELVEILTAASLLIGALFALVGSIGLARLPDIFTRLHGPTKATTLGVGGILVGSILFFSVREGLSLHELLVTVFLFLTAPVSAHLLARAALHRHCSSEAPVPEEDHPPAKGSAALDPKVGMAKAGAEGGDSASKGT
jgi:multicomponent K+:H+ antiporter subunit G